MKYTPLMPFLIAAAFYLPHAHAHAAEQPAAPAWRKRALSLRGGSSSRS